MDREVWTGKKEQRWNVKKTIFPMKIELFPKKICGKFRKLCMVLLPFENNAKLTQKEESQRDWLKSFLTSEVK